MASVIFSHGQFFRFEFKILYTKVEFQFIDLWNNYNKKRWSLTCRRSYASVTETGSVRCVSAILPNESAGRTGGGGGKEMVQERDGAQEPDYRTHWPQQAKPTKGEEIYLAGVEN